MPPNPPAPLERNDTSTSSVWELPPSPPPFVVSAAGLEGAEEDVVIPDQVSPVSPHCGLSPDRERSSE